MYVCVCYHSRQAGHRLCNHINRIMILLEEYSQCDDDELREFCIQACEAFVQKCPEAITEHIPLVNFNFHFCFQFNRKLESLNSNYFFFQ